MVLKKFVGVLQSYIRPRGTWNELGSLIEDSSWCMYDDKPIERTVEKILATFKKKGGTRRVGLCGEGGSGKTTVLETLFIYATIKKRFKKVIWVTASRSFHLKNIQDDILQQLSLEVPLSDSDYKRRTLITQAFKSKKILLILDDVHEKIDLSTIGIPDPDRHNSFCMVLATRWKTVCLDMAAEEVPVDVISHTFAKKLLRLQVGDAIDSSEISPYSDAVVSRCCYSPLIVSAVASALGVDSSAEEWKFAAEIKMVPETRVTYFLNPHLKYCYGRLNGNDVKECFLYSALLLEDKKIHISLMAEHFITAGLIIGTSVAVYTRANDIVQQLIKASLIHINDNTEMIKMHPVIRHSALAILLSSTEDVKIFLGDRFRRLVAEQGSTSEQIDESICKYLIKVGSELKEPLLVQEWDEVGSKLKKPLPLQDKVGNKLKKPPPLQEWDKVGRKQKEHREWQQATLIFLMHNEFSILPEEPSCSNLVSLFLNSNRHLRVIPASFFNRMCTLTNLNLSKTSIWSLPNSLFNLKGLQILLICDCENLTELPSEIGQLTALQVLDLHGTELINLPDTISELKSLRCLRVSFLGSPNHSSLKKMVGDQILSKITRLEELGIFVYPGDKRWTLNETNISKEVTGLKLSTICFHFSEVHNLDGFLEGNSWKNESVKEFNFIVGHDFKRSVSLVSRDMESVYNSSERCLKLVNGEAVHYGVVNVLRRATSLYLDHHISISSLTDFGIDNINDLEICILCDCPKVKSILQLEEDTKVILPTIEYLSINSLAVLDSIISGPQIAEGSFGMLKCLSVSICPELRFIFTCSVAKNLKKLEELVIEDCGSLKCIIEDDITNEHDIYEEFIVFPCLKVVKLHYLPRLVEIRGRMWPNVSYLSFYRCPLLQNLHMTPDEAKNVTVIAADKDWWSSLKWDEDVLWKRLNDVFTQIELDNLYN